VTAFSGSTGRKENELTNIFAFPLESAIYERIVRKKQFDQQTLILLAESRTTKENQTTTA
jgi:hypothetical protein